jgi:hypothetical protein
LILPASRDFLRPFLNMASAAMFCFLDRRLRRLNSAQKAVKA